MGIDIELFWTHLRGQEDTEAGATAGSVTYLDSSAMRQDDGLADCQAQPVARHVRLLRCLLAEEWLKDMFAVFRRDAWTFVLDEELQVMCIAQSSRDGDAGVWWGVLDCVLDEICHHALHLSCIHPNRGETHGYLQPKRSVSHYTADSLKRAADDDCWINEGVLCARRAA